MVMEVERSELRLPDVFAGSRPPNPMSETVENVIEIRVDGIAQLFHTLDPFPFREKDLDREAEEYIVGWARELPADRPFRVIVHFPNDESQTDLARDLPEALGKYFAGRAAVIQGDLNELFRIGRRSLAIGVAILVACLLAANLVSGFLTDASSRRIVQESFLILGWVAKLAAARDLPLRLVANRASTRS